MASRRHSMKEKITPLIVANADEIPYTGSGKSRYRYEDNKPLGVGGYGKR